MEKRVFVKQKKKKESISFYLIKLMRVYLTFMDNCPFHYELLISVTAYLYLLWLSRCLADIKMRLENLKK